jgi:tetratricopeptide (TPR) repeat protein
LGDLYFELRYQVKQSEDYYQLALEIYKEIGSRLGEANCLQGIGDVLRFLARNAEALNHYNQAISLYCNVGSRLGEANCLKAIGDVLRFLKRNEEALNHYNQAISLFRNVGDRIGEANIVQDLGKLQDDPVQKLEYLQQAQNLYIQIGDIYSQSRNLLYFLADVYLTMGQRDTAINALKDGAKLAAANNLVFFVEYAQDKLGKLNGNEELGEGSSN